MTERRDIAERVREENARRGLDPDRPTSGPMVDMMVRAGLSPARCRKAVAHIAFMLGDGYADFRILGRERVGTFVSEAEARIVELGG